MKILQISYSLSSGGGERLVVDLCNRLAENPDNEVILLTCNDDRIPKNVHYLSDLSPKVRFINIHSSSGMHPKSFWGIYKIIKAEKPDIVHAHCNVMMLYLPALFIKHVKYVHTLHNLANICLKFKWNKNINNCLYQHRIQPITISNICQESYIKLYGRKDSICITNGREALIPSGKKLNDVDFLKTGGPVFIHVARCTPQKNQPRLFKAFDRLQKDGVKFHLMVLGSNYEKDWMLKYKNNPQIHIIGERHNVGDYMDLADFFILSSDYEGLPLALLEAMSLGVTPISTPCGGVVDVIDNGRNGYLTKTFDDDEFYHTIKTAILERGKYNKDAIKSEYESNYSMKVCADKYYKVYKQLLNR